MKNMDVLVRIQPNHINHDTKTLKFLFINGYLPDFNS